jgi:excisionase family DNA binding protein
MVLEPDDIEAIAARTAELLEQGMPDVLTVDQAAERAQCSSKTIRGAIAAGELVASNIGKGAQRPQWRIFVDDLQAWLVARRPHARARTAPTPQRGSLRALHARMNTGGDDRAAGGQR